MNNYLREKMNDWSPNTTAPSEGDEDKETGGSPAANRRVSSTLPTDRGPLQPTSTGTEQQHTVSHRLPPREVPHQAAVSGSPYIMPHQVPVPVPLQPVYNTGRPPFFGYDYPHKGVPQTTGTLPWIQNEPSHAPAPSLSLPPGQFPGSALTGVTPQTVQPSTSTTINTIPTVPYPDMIPNTTLAPNMPPFHMAYHQNQHFNVVPQRMNESNPYPNAPGEGQWRSMGPIEIRTGIAPTGSASQLHNTTPPNPLAPPTNLQTQAPFPHLKTTEGPGIVPPSTQKHKPRSKSKSGSSSPKAGTSGQTRPVTRRSRMGCLTCRHRKKRCCETRPKCTECTRLRLNCVWPKPGTEHKNKPREAKEEENTENHEIYGKIKVLRGIVEYKSN